MSIKNIAVSILIMFLCSNSSFARVSVGIQSGGGGDALEAEFEGMRLELKDWVMGPGPDSLKLPHDMTVEFYREEMTKALQDGYVTIDFTSADLDISGNEKICIWKINSQNRSIQCNRRLYQGLDQFEKFRLIHHEFAGIAGIEKNQDSVSTYHLSNQIFSFVIQGEIPLLANSKRKYPGLIMIPEEYSKDGTVRVGRVARNSFIVYQNVKLPLKEGERVSFDEKGNITQTVLEDEFDFVVLGQSVRVRLDEGSDQWGKKGPIILNIYDDDHFRLSDCVFELELFSRNLNVAGINIRPDKIDVSLVPDGRFNRIPIWGKEALVSFFSMNTQGDILGATVVEKTIQVTVQDQEIWVKPFEYKPIYLTFNENGQAKRIGGVFAPVDLDLMGSKVKFFAEGSKGLKLFNDQSILHGHGQGLFTYKYKNQDVVCGSTYFTTEIEFYKNGQLKECTFMDYESPATRLTIAGSDIELGKGKIEFHKNGSIRSLTPRSPFKLSVQQKEILVNPLSIRFWDNGYVQSFNSLTEVTLYSSSGDKIYFPSQAYINLDKNGYVIPRN